MMAPNSNSLYVSYQGLYIEVDIRQPDLRDEFKYIFGRLLTLEPGESFGILRVTEDEAGFIIDGAKHMEGRAANMRSALQQLKFEVIHRLIEQTSGQIWLHAGAASCRNKGVLLCGTWGKGKSTLVSELCHAGWQYLSDDIVPIDMDTRSLYPFHLTPMRRMHDRRNQDRSLSPFEVSKLTKETIPLTEDSYQVQRASLEAIILPDYSPSSIMSLEKCAPSRAAMVLLENCLNLKDLQQDAIQFIASLVETVPVYRLPYTEGDEAARLVAESVLAGNDHF